MGVERGGCWRLVRSEDPESGRGYLQHTERCFVCFDDGVRSGRFIPDLNGIGDAG
jgi:hypothetical protein